MEPKNWSTINLSQSQIRDVEQFCKLNKIEDIPSFLLACLKQGYEIEKYGLLGKMGGEQEKWVEKEVIREKRVEIPVEVIKEVEKIVEVIKEVPVEKIVEVIKEVPIEKIVTQEVIKEVPVEKIVTVYDNSNESELLLKIQQLENRPPEIVEVEKIVEVVKEVVVEKTTTDNSKQKMLEETIQKLRNELQLKNKEITDLNNTIQDIQKSTGSRGVFLDGSNLGKFIK